MSESVIEKKITLAVLMKWFGRILGPERDFYWLVVIYGIGISLLSLATPISVQMLINTVANTGLATPLVVLSLALFGLLLISGLLNALRVHLMEIFGRRFYARLVSEITLRSVYAQNPFFSDDGKSALFNRYFDIITVQKTIPYLLIGGFTVLLQAGVGFILVSLYHPFFLAFIIVIVLLLALIWIIWGRGAVRTAINLSQKKHQTAAWLESLGSSNGFYKSERHIERAMQRTDEETAGYVEEHRRHFRYHFAQTLSFLLIYAAASAILLGLGGWLVIQGQLSLGQLVAAELVLSAAFFGVSQLGSYLTYFYDLCASIEELSLFYDVAQEEPTGKRSPVRADSSLVFKEVKGDARGRPAVLDFTVDSGAMIIAGAADHGVQRLMTNLLKRHDEMKSGYIALGGYDILDTEVHALRQEIIVLDRPTIIETTIRDYLDLSAAEGAPDRVLDVLELVGLQSVIVKLDQGLDAPLAATGWPLSITETMQLKLAAAILARPRVLILNQLYDLVAAPCIERAIAHLRRDPAITVIYFSNRDVDLGCQQFLYLDLTEQRYLPSITELRQRLYADNETNIHHLDETGKTPPLTTIGG